LSENTQVIVGEVDNAIVQSASNPFVPKMPSTKKKTNE
jgi:hypothetical protein